MPFGRGVLCRRRSRSGRASSIRPLTTNAHETRAALHLALIVINYRLYAPKDIVQRGRAGRVGEQALTDGTTLDALRAILNFPEKLDYYT